MSKVKSPVQKPDKQSEKRTVMGFGTFDGIHEGHLNFFKQLKTLGDFLMIVVARDKSVKRIKKKPAHFDENQRYNALKKIADIDQVILGNENDFYQVITNHQPDIIGLGYDQKANIKEIQKRFPSIRMVRLKAFKPEKYKSSLIGKRG